MQVEDGEVEGDGEVAHTVFVFNLSSCVREEILYELFLQAGPVQKVFIPKDRDGNQKSYGFVYYKHAEAVPYAIALLDGIWLYGCPIALRHHYAHILTAQEDHSWRDGGPYFPPVMPWAWPNVGFVSWTSHSDELTQASDRTNSAVRGGDRYMGLQNPAVGRRSHERRNRQKKKYRS
ncbi:RNA binding motif protein 11 [Tachysurus vachellii]|uniref:RNA binding motif protein 11 n=1 Tax=Tachysurus vachellii TaxID=175792 RepID=UPI00296ADDD1|nr:RNA binding motif protein 11 [Tachysurus vachellii]